MENNHFEKQVQEKMADLKIQPSPKNWSEIERRIRKKKIDKRFFWLFLAGIILLAGGGYLLFQPKERPVHQVTQFPVNNIKAPPTRKDENVNLIPQIQKESPDKAPNENKKGPESAIKNSQSAELIIASLKEKGGHSKLPISKKPIHFNNQSFTKSQSVEELNHNTDHGERMIKPGNEPLLKINNQPVELVNPISNESLVNEPLLSGKVNNEWKEENAAKIVAEADVELKGKIQDTSDILVVDKKGEIEPKRKVTATKSKWEWGFTLSGGKATSGNGINLAMIEGNKSFDLNSAMNSISPGYAISRPASINISKPKSSVGFKAGMVVKKNITPHVSLLSGLNYTYYSNTLQINTQSSFVNTNYSTNTDQYRNNFHFLDLPVLVEYQLNDNNKIPLRVSAGVTFSRLLISDAVELKDGYFVRDGSHLNKTQVGIGAGFSATFFNKLSVGPFVDYGLGKIADQGVFENKHWSYIGLKLDYLLKK